MLIKSLIYRRLPWVRVVEARDCGAAVFASVARYFGHHLTLERARNLVGTDRNGTTHFETNETDFNKDIQKYGVSGS